MVLRRMWHACNGEAAGNLRACPAQLINDVVTGVDAARHVGVQEPKDLVAVTQIAEPLLRPLHDVCIGAARGVQRSSLTVDQDEGGTWGQS